MINPKKEVDEQILNNLYYQFSKLYSQEIISILSIGGIDTIDFTDEVMENKYKERGIDFNFLSKKDFDLTNDKIRKILNSALIKRKNKTLELYEFVWKKNYQIDFYRFQDIVKQFFINIDDIHYFFKKTGVSKEVLLRLLKVLLERYLICLKNKRIHSNIPLQQINLNNKKENKEPKRKLLNGSFDQYFCTWESSIKRAEKIKNDNYIQNKKVLFVGDDDLVSIALARITNAEIHVLEIDNNLVNNINELSKNENLNIKAHECDITNGIPPRFNNYFDVFMCDPPYTLVGLEIFILEGWNALKKKVGTRAYISFDPIFTGTQYTFLVEKFILNLGFQIEEIIKNFSEYPPYKGTNYFWNKFDKNHNFNSNFIQNNSYLYSNLYVLRLLFPDMGNDIKSHKGKIYDHFLST